MSDIKAPDFFVQTENGDLHAYWDAAILRIDLKKNGFEKVTVLSRDYRKPTVTYTEVRCYECFDHDEQCQECCPHEFDSSEGYTCLNCGKEGAEEVMSAAYDRAKDRMKYGE